jgi:hypothetical protein
MQHGTWLAIESSQWMMSAFRTYRKLPSSVRIVLRWLIMPRWHLAAALVRRRASETVISGPFRGMRLSLSSLSEKNHLGYVLGTQELELRDIVEDIVQRRYTEIINIGAADGYYAVGFLRRMPETRVLAFEAAPEHHSGLRRIAALNHVTQRLRIAGLCNRHQLANELASSCGSVLIFADIEGGEVELLDPDNIPQLRRVDILVETHDAFVPNCTEFLIQRFRASHHISQVSSRARTLTDFPSAVLPGLARLLPRTSVELMTERRKERQTWLYLAAKQMHADTNGSFGADLGERRC